jgi:hypothetical protein
VLGEDDRRMIDAEGRTAVEWWSEADGNLVTGLRVQTVKGDSAAHAKCPCVHQRGVSTPDEPTSESAWAKLPS